MSPRAKANPAELAALLAGDEPKKKMTRVLSGSRSLNLVQIPKKIADYFAAQGRNTFPASSHDSLRAIYSTRGASTLTVEDLPEDQREEMLRDARSVGYSIRSDDHTIAMGGCLLFTQLESERQEWEDEEREMLEAQMGEQVDMAETLNAQLASEFGPLHAGRVEFARDGRHIPVVNPGGR